MKRSLALMSALLMLFFLGAATGFAQSGSLAASTNKTVVDGVVNPGEYSYNQEFGPLSPVRRIAPRTPCTSRSRERRTGWVAVGLGSLKMNGSTIFIGFVGNGRQGAIQGTGGQRPLAQGCPLPSVRRHCRLLCHQGDGRTVTDPGDRAEIRRVHQVVVSRPSSSSSR